MRHVYISMGIALLVGVVVSDHGYGNRPRGVPLTKAALYAPKVDFQCLDGSKLIPFEQVNDDYCDCPDGSDEPGTSACANGVFHCINIGHTPLDVPSSRVNDFICDCCDGSDEWDSEVKCPNVCNEVGAKAREEAEKRHAIVTAGFHKRNELAKEGQKLIKEKTGGVDGLREQVDELTTISTAAEAAKTAAEEKEQAAKDAEDQAWEEALKEVRAARALKLFNELDADNDQQLTLGDVKQIAELDTDLDGQVSDEEAKDFLGSDEPYDIGRFAEEAFESVQAKLDRTRNKPTEAPVDEDDELNAEDVTPAPVTEGTEGEEDADDDEPKKPPYSAETQALIDAATKARNDYLDASGKLQEAEQRIRDAESFVELDYGSDSAWAPLRGHCVELDVLQYTYKLCIFDRASQKDKGGYHDITLGVWNAWVGPEDNKYSAQEYNRGQSCWNGPERSTRVEVVCGEETKLLEVSEPSKCEYRFVLETPAGCDDPAKLVQPTHAEL